ncbi:hypothetical protein HRE53_31510 (plasmid) [Acaryochloris sp. 'Moss Beach']|uniref:hypothetical protein n=1 Tax=Acaryochloris sp. 'Moss Beach' TaxID=2740837 RepID=UPI001F311DCC|nr:hypothetical protein [Acaryochloris sp. 'Moss Beach']UJB73230.1 hypothetical protein HRE53_31510 [Acaryochloris sp. 'Moss Beach']
MPSIYQIIGRKLLALSKVKLPSAGLDLGEGNLDSLQVAGGELSFDDVNKNTDFKSLLSQNIENLIKFLEAAIAKSKPLDFRIIICFDRVDEAWDDVSVDISRKVLRVFRFLCKP